MNKLNQLQAELRLFKSYVLDYYDNDYTQKQKDTDIVLNQRYLKYGLFFNTISYILPTEVLNLSIQMYGKDGEKWNKTFHKSFNTVKCSDISELIAHQLIHYFTTYGLEQLGLFDNNLVYIPAEKLEIPELKEDIPLIVINEITKSTLHNKLMELLTSNIALSSQTVEDILCLSDYLNPEDVDNITNTEVRIALYDKFNIVPKDNVMFLRYLIYKLTNTPLLIKSKEVVFQLQRCDTDLLYTYLTRYVQDPDGYIKLSQIFLRYKCLFLAMKRKTKSKYSKEINKIINRIGKLSKTNHIPVGTSILDNMTSISDLKTAITKMPKIKKYLQDCTIFRKIRILNGINFRLNTKSKYIVYKIRNGKAWVESKKPITLMQQSVLLYLKELVEESIRTQLQGKLQGKTIYLPDNIQYKVPQSEKQFTGNIPEGSYIQVGRNDNLVIGISWKNVSTRVDLDLKATNHTETYGWDAKYRSNEPNESFYFSGDVTDAKNGATELFFIGKNVTGKSFMLCVNNYTCNNEDVPFDLVVAKCTDEEITCNYVIDPNNIITTIPFKMEKGQPFKSVGFVSIEQDEIQVCFKDFNLGKAITTTDSNLTDGAYDYLTQFNKYQLSIKDLLFMCNIPTKSLPYVEDYKEYIDENTGETFYKKITKPVDYDLSLDKLDKSTIINLLC